MNSATLTAAIREYGSAKDVALAAGCSEATAARYRRGETMPNPVCLARLMGRSREIANAMLRLAGLDDLSMDLEEARLRRELAELQAQRGGPQNEEAAASPGASSHPLVGTRGRLAKAADAMENFALKRAERALRDSERWRR